VLDTAVDGIIIVDEQARILMANRACEKLFGYSATDLLGRNVKMIMPPDEAGEHDGFMTDYVRHGVRKIIGIDRDVKVRHRDGTIFPINVSVGEASTPDGRQFIGILRDLRPRQEAEQRLNQLQADLLRMARVSAMDEMGAALAHELNQPLTALMLYLQAVERSCAMQAAGTALPQSALSILERAVREAERAGSIVQRMRQFVEKHDPVRRLVALNPLVDDAVDLTLLGSRPGTSIARTLADDLPPVLVDPVQIQQVVVNLTRNALEAVKDYSAADVRVATMRADDKVVLSIQDNGPGIDPVAVPDLFRAFSSPKGTGMGLGLAISRTIAQNHGGDLVVEPGGNGRGACFKLQLPIPATTDG
jgi:two-component system, LuxR family, sensor kinase FixL